MIDTKTTLLLEAETLIRTRGYSGFSYADLAEIVGIRKASIHHHFPTKESLVAATLEGYRDRYARNLARIEADHADVRPRQLAGEDAACPAHADKHHVGRLQSPGPHRPPGRGAAPASRGS